MTVRSGGELIAIAPLLMTRRGLSLSSRLEFLGTGPAGSDYLDLIVRAGHEDEALDALASEIDARRLPLHFDHLPPASLAERLQDRLTSSGWTAIESSPDVCPFIDLTGHSWESYLAGLGSSHRANYRRRLRALSAGFDVHFGVVESDEERRKAMDALIGFHRQRWSGRGGSTAFAEQSLCAFHHQLTRRSHDADWLRLYVLTLDGVTAAVMYGFALDDRFYFYQHGFSDAYADYGVGLVLMGLTIQAAIVSGATEFDLLYGHEPYKHLWARAERKLGRRQLFPPHFGGSLLRRQVETRRALRNLAHHIGLRRRDGHP
jgi:CelD/BcsL family acetyltransferase involved in cellulose biosynthesis